MSDDVLWGGLLTGAWVGRRIRQNREATANAVGAAVAANLNPGSAPVKHPAAQDARIRQTSRQIYADLTPAQRAEVRANEATYHQSQLDLRIANLRALPRERLIQQLYRQTPATRRSNLSLFTRRERRDIKDELRLYHES
jgi:hypothetical protein